MSQDDVHLRFFPFQRKTNGDSSHRSTLGEEDGMLLPEGARDGALVLSGALVDPMDG